MLVRLKKLNPATQARLDEIKRVWQAGMRAKDIAAAVKFKATGPSIIGFFDRWSTELLPCYLVRPKKGKAKTSVIPKLKTKAKRSDFSVTPKINFPVKPVLPEPELPPNFQHLDLMQVNETTCRWPSSNGKIITFCGCAVSKAPYCAYHAEFAFSTPIKR